MKKITYYLYGKAYEYIPEVRVRLHKNYDIKYFWVLERYLDKIRKIESKTDWRISEKYMSRARKAAHRRWIERVGFTAD